VALKIKQIQVVSVPDVYNTQCHAFMYALCEDGSLWFKRDNDEKWQPETVPQINEAQNTIDNSKSEQCCDNPNICFYGLNETKCYNCGEIFSK